MAKGKIGTISFYDGYVVRKMWIIKFKVDAGASLWVIVGTC